MKVVELPSAEEGLPMSFSKDVEEGICSSTECPTPVSVETVGGRTTSTPGTPNSVNTSTSADFESGADSKRRQFRTYFECAVKAFGVTKTGMLLKPSSASNNEIADADSTEICGWLQEHVSSELPFDAVLEIGAGVGRLTPMLQALCRKAVVVDFLETYIDMNRKLNYDSERRPDDEFLCADATQLCYPSQSFNMVFWNWLLMYLSDEEVKTFICRVADWLKVGGYIFCRESCGEPSNRSVDRPWATEGNPTEYRPWRFYTWLLTDYANSMGCQLEAVFEERPVSAYVKQAGTDGQRCWLIRRVA